MIPKHLKGKSAAEIVGMFKDNYISKSYNNVEERTLFYIRQLEIYLLLAIKDALMNAESMSCCETLTSRGLDAEGRAIAYLNLLAPYKVKELTYDEKLEKMAELGDFAIRYRPIPFIGDKPLTQYYVDQNVEIKDGSILRSISGNGNTPREALEDHWEQLINLRKHEYVILDPGTKRECYKWNGEEWERYNEKR